MPRTPLTDREVDQLRSPLVRSVTSDTSLTADQAAVYLACRCRNGHVTDRVEAWPGGPIVCPDCLVAQAAARSWRPNRS